MGLFNVFSGSGQKTEKTASVAQHDIELPFEVIQVPGSEAIATCIRLREEGKGVFWPVMFGNRENVSAIANSLADAASNPEEIITKSNGIDVASYFADREQEEREGLDQDIGEITGVWPGGKQGASSLIGHADIQTRKPLPIVYIGKIPTPHSWEVPAYLNFGGWNSCPPPEVNVAILRYWHKRYNADIITVSGEILECTVDNPPTEKEECMKLASEQFLFCGDIVYQGTDTIANLAAGLVGSGSWYFWWD